MQNLWVAPALSCPPPRIRSVRWGHSFRMPRVCSPANVANYIVSAVQIFAYGNSRYHCNELRRQTGNKGMTYAFHLYCTKIDG